MRWRDLVPRRPPRPDDFPTARLGEGFDYTPFVVVAPARSGSSMLIQALRAHPGVIAFGEVFNPRHIGFNTPGFDNDNPRLRAWRNRHPAEFLDPRRVPGLRCGGSGRRL